MNRPLLLLLIVFVALALIYAWATPPLEASDELWHFGLVDHLASGGDLPTQDPEITTPWEQEGSQPPLYYFIAAALIRPIDRSDLDAIRQPNPHAKAGVPLDRDNKNLVLHDAPRSLESGSALAVYAARLFSIALGAVTVIAVYLSAHLLAPERIAVPFLAAGLTAFNPMFLFITASVNNDNLVIALGSLITWQMLLMVRDGFRLRRSALLAVLLALAGLTKISGLVFVPVVALAGLESAVRSRDWRGLLTLAALMLGAWLLIDGWWYARNLWLYGELLGTEMMVAVAGPRLEPFTISTLLAEFQGFRISYWGLFGAVNVLTVEPFYIIMDFLTLAAAGGLAWSLWRGRQDRDFLFRAGLLILLIILGNVGVIQWTAQTYASQGRLLFPFIAAISSLMALGLAAPLEAIPFARLEVVRRAGIGAVAALGAFALIIPFASIAPAYAPPPALAALPADAHPVYARFGDDIALVGYRAEDRRYEPGDFVPVTLYWQVDGPVERNLSLYVHAVTDDGTVIGKVDSYPGGGTQCTSAWEPGLYEDTYAVPIGEEAPGPAHSGLRISVGWWDYSTRTVLTPVAEDSAPLESVMLGAGGFVNPAALAAAPDGLTPVSGAEFGGLMRLLGYRLEEDTLTLWWEATGTPPLNYTVFAQVLDDGDAIVGQGDAPPALPTGYWRPGERYATTHSLTYLQEPSSGSYRIVIGWYNPADFSRLSTGQPDAAYTLTTLTRP